MASVTKTAQGTWRARWRVPSEGKTKSKGETFPTKREATARLVKVQHDLAGGTYVDSSAGKVTLRVWGDQWLASRVDVRPSTHRAMTTALRRHTFPHLGDRAVGDLTTRDLRALVARWDDAMAPGTVRVHAAHLRACLAAAVEDGLIPSSPWQRIRLPRIERRDVVPLTPDEVEALTGALPDRLALLVPLWVGSGLRPGELLGLGVEHVEGLPVRRGHLAAVGAEAGPGLIRVRRQLLAPENGGPIAPLKTAASHREVPIPPYLVALIAGHLDTYGPGEDCLLFATTEGGPSLRPAVVRAWRRAADAVGVEGGPHRMRHSYASALIRGGLSPVAVAKILGHSSASITLDTYSHMWRDDDDRARGSL
ncbi:site-specific integrase [soil metagenome]